MHDAIPPHPNAHVFMAWCTNTTSLCTIFTDSSRIFFSLVCIILTRNALSGARCDFPNKMASTLRYRLLNLPFLSILLWFHLNAHVLFMLINFIFFRISINDINNFFNGSETYSFLSLILVSLTNKRRNTASRGSSADSSISKEEDIFLHDSSRVTSSWLYRLIDLNKAVAR